MGTFWSKPAEPNNTRFNQVLTETDILQRLDACTLAVTSTVTAQADHLAKSELLWQGKFAQMIRAPMAVMPPVPHYLPYDNIHDVVFRVVPRYKQLCHGMHLVAKTSVDPQRKFRPDALDNQRLQMTKDFLAENFAEVLYVSELVSEVFNDAYADVKMRGEPQALREALTTSLMAALPGVSLVACRRLAIFMTENAARIAGTAALGPAIGQVAMMFVLVTGAASAFGQIVATIDHVISDVLPRRRAFATYKEFASKHSFDDALKAWREHMGEDGLALRDVNDAEALHRAVVLADDLQALALMADAQEVGHDNAQ